MNSQYKGISTTDPIPRQAFTLPHYPAENVKKSISGKSIAGPTSGSSHHAPFNTSCQSPSFFNQDTAPIYTLIPSQALKTKHSLLSTKKLRHDKVMIPNRVRSPAYLPSLPHPPLALPCYNPLYSRSRPVAGTSNGSSLGFPSFVCLPERLRALRQINRIHIGENI